MPNKKAARKAIRQSQKNRARNLRVERDVHSAIKASRESIVAGKEDREQRVFHAIKKLDRGVAKGIIKKIPQRAKNPAWSKVFTKARRFNLYYTLTRQRPQARL